MALISFSGIASGIDSQALIEALLDQQRAARVKPLQAKIAGLEDTNESLTSLSSLLGKLSSAIDGFRTVNGSIVAKRATSSDETVLGATAQAGAANGSYQITVDQLAKNGTLSLKSSATTYTSTDQAIGASIDTGLPDADRTVSVTLGSGAGAETIDIVLTDTTSLSDFVSEFNERSTKGVASLVDVGGATSDYRVVISSTSEGEEDGTILITSGTELSADNIFDDNLLDQAENAEFRISGIGDSGGATTISRSTNSIADVIPGLTFTLSGISSTPVTVTVGDDVGQTTQSMQSFVDAYNAIVDYIKEFDAITSEQEGGEIVNTFGALASTSLDENVLSVLRNALSGASISGHTINTSSDLGLSTERDGTLKFDPAAFATALAEDPEAVQLITQNLGDALGGVDGSLAQFTRFGGLLDSAEESNKTQITSLNNRISGVESALTKQEQTLTQQFARLEALIGQLSSTQSTLAQILPQ